MNKFLKCFAGFGKLKDIQLHIAINDEVDHVVQPVRRIPYGLHEKLENELDDLERLDILEKVKASLKWVVQLLLYRRSKGFRYVLI